MEETGDAADAGAALSLQRQNSSEGASSTREAEGRLTLRSDLKCMQVERIVLLW